MRSNNSFWSVAAPKVRSRKLRPLKAPSCHLTLLQVSIYSLAQLWLSLDVDRSLDDS